MEGEEYKGHLWQTWDTRGWTSALCNIDTPGRDQLTHAHKQELKEEWDHLHFCPLIPAMHCTVKDMQWEILLLSSPTVQDVWARGSTGTSAAVHYSAELRDFIIIQFYDVPKWNHDQGCRTRTLSVCLPHSSLLSQTRMAKRYQEYAFTLLWSPSWWQVFRTQLYEGFWCWYAFPSCEIC